ncbi:MAG: hypothetical protein ISS43_01430, partial [Candidatus Omnitrophica bacterium]|nr:hypothetical protein [Candidatus Omnitrophota bacterium]
MEKDKPDAQLNNLARSSKLEARSEKLKARRESLRDSGLSLWFDPHSKPWLKVMACIVIGAFLHQDIVWAAGSTYTDDLKSSFEQPRRVIERLGALFSIKEAYAGMIYDFGGGNNSDSWAVNTPPPAPAPAPDTNTNSSFGSGAATGAAIGSVFGPVGTFLGAGIGAAVGGYNAASNYVETHDFTSSPAPATNTPTYEAPSNYQPPSGGWGGGYDAGNVWTSNSFSDPNYTDYNGLYSPGINDTFLIDNSNNYTGYTDNFGISDTFVNGDILGNQDYGVTGFDAGNSYINGDIFGNQDYGVNDFNIGDTFVNGGILGNQDYSSGNFTLGDTYINGDILGNQDYGVTGFDAGNSYINGDIFGNQDYSSGNFNVGNTLVNGDILGNQDYNSGNFNVGNTLVNGDILG